MENTKLSGSNRAQLKVQRRTTESSETTPENSRNGCIGDLPSVYSMGHVDGVSGVVSPV